MGLVVLLDTNKNEYYVGVFDDEIRWDFLKFGVKREDFMVFQDKAKAYNAWMRIIDRFYEKQKAEEQKKSGKEEEDPTEQYLPVFWQKNTKLNAPDSLTIVSAQSPYDEIPNMVLELQPRVDTRDEDGIEITTFYLTTGEILEGILIDAPDEIQAKYNNAKLLIKTDAPPQEGEGEEGEGEEGEGESEGKGKGKKGEEGEGEEGEGEGEGEEGESEGQRKTKPNQQTPDVNKPGNEGEAESDEEFQKREDKSLKKDVPLDVLTPNHLIQKLADALGKTVNQIMPYLRRESTLITLLAISDYEKVQKEFNTTDTKSEFARKFIEKIKG